MYATFGSMIRPRNLCRQLAPTAWRSASFVWSVRVSPPTVTFRPSILFRRSVMSRARRSTTCIFTASSSGSDPPCRTAFSAQSMFRPRCAARERM